jgi:hypothetical protein
MVRILSSSVDGAMVIHSPSNSVKVPLDPSKESR